ncbi:Glycosylphosphatidylinositol (GPI) anchor assembly protein [Fusarium irregulare]|uniref:Glycosylphosphatidylinositol (GPI) anchor assembly protein n=1 Tax=Fusarium irregulare TaxID=2494466 RepID=A0A9W8PZ94_9HYPO|nr:Glycosylphosphatidylinositol (GPI) anchor assembly protein [Fusarium irregulare]KAJ4028162.1 Glycosylphosphatidylinositol (GPI) anchor assembly protein [Fusarium irregulare]
MSTTLVKSGPAQQSAPKAAVPAIPLVNSPLALPASIAHAALLGGLFYWRFDALVADPVSTLQTGLPVVAAIQAVYLMLSLPPAGSSLSSKKLRPGEKKKSADGREAKAIPTAVISLLLALILTPALHILLVLFGAPFLTHIPHTLLCCAHIAVLAIYPVFYVRGSDPVPLQAVIGVSAPFDQTFGGFVGTVVGAWLGAVPIPLDWDREWQKWPVTIVAGAYLGYIVGSQLLGNVLFGKRWAVTPEIKEE